MQSFSLPQGSLILHYNNYVKDLPKAKEPTAFLMHDPGVCLALATYIAYYHNNLLDTSATSERFSLSILEQAIALLQKYTHFEDLFTERDALILQRQGETDPEKAETLSAQLKIYYQADLVA